MARAWFERMRECGDDVRELMHDGAPTACVGDAGFGYVNAFRAHVDVGFFRGSALPDPVGLLEGTGKHGRHVKLRPSTPSDPAALGALIIEAYRNIKSALIDARIEDLGDWRSEMLSRLRALIKDADPEVVEEWKWDVPVWSHHGVICTGETYKKVVKMTFARGASLKDPSRLFNSSLDGRVRRAIDFHEGDKPDEKALKALIRTAVAWNESSARGRSRKS
jgi:hypothetical protein